MSKPQVNYQIPKSELVKIYRQAVAERIPLDKIDQKVRKLSQRAEISTVVQEQVDSVRTQKLRKQLPLMVRVFSWLIPMSFIGIGIALVGSAAGPIVWQMAQSSFSWQAQLDTPIPREEVLDVVPQVIAQTTSTDSEGSAEKTSPTILDVKLDYTNLSNWFEDPVPMLDEGSVHTYMLRIPKLKIENALVTIGGTNLNKSLIQYPGTADPGDLGAPVIFGHSVLRQFYNPSPKNPNRYNSIFSTIMTLQKGDEIYLTFENVEYTYRVLEKTEVKPEDTYILAQRHDAKLLKLVTCTPEGTYLRRGVITAQLVE